MKRALDTKILTVFIENETEVNQIATNLIFQDMQKDSDKKFDTTGVLVSPINS